MLQRGAAVSRAELLERVWNLKFDPGSGLLDVHVSRLRDKLGSCSGSWKPCADSATGCGPNHEAARRLGSTVLFVTAVTMGVALATVAEVFNRSQRRELDSALLDVARAEAGEARANGYRFSSRPGPAANDVGPLTKFGVSYDSAGVVIAATEPFDRNPPPITAIRHPLGDPFDLRFLGKHLRCVLISVPDSQGKLLLLAASREDLDSDEEFSGARCWPHTRWRSCGPGCWRSGWCDGSCDIMKGSRRLRGVLPAAISTRGSRRFLPIRTSHSSAET
jgi:hypothetical protein